MSEEKKKKSKSLNSTLKSVAKLAEEQQELMSKLTLGTATKDIFKTAEQIRKTFENPALKDAFKTVDLYSNSLKALKNSLATHNIDSLQKLISSTLPSYLKKDYQLVFKATEQFKKTEEQLKSLGILKDRDEELKKLTQITGIKSPLDYAKEVAKQTASLSQSGILKQLEEQKEETIESIKPKRAEVVLKPIGTDNKLLDSLSESARLEAKKAAEKEKREKEIHKNSETQTKLLESIMNYMIQQSKNLSLQNEILTRQVKKLQQQNDILEKQQVENRKSSKMALWIAIISIILGIFIGFGQIYFSYIIYKWEDQSDNKNHTELLQAIEKIGGNKELPPLIKKQIKSSQKINELLERLLEQQKKTNKKGLKQKEIKQ